MIDKMFIKKDKSFLTKIKRHPISNIMYKLFFFVLGLMPVKKNLVMFESFSGKQYSDNPRAIYEYLNEHNFGLDLYWSVDKRYLQYFNEENIKYIERFSFKWFVYMARAHYWVTNSRMPKWMPKPRHTLYLQTWHGTPLKRLAADMEEVHIPGVSTEKYKKEFIQEAKNWDYLISPNAYSTEIFKSAFQFKKEIIESGYPRNDYLYRNNNKESIDALKEKYNIPKDKKVILYAPTWRDNMYYEIGKYRFDIELDLNHMQEMLGKQYIILLRMHYLVAENLDLFQYQGFAYDFSNHKDISELYLVSDILITDYSSVFFDYGNLRRPILFFVYDIESYKETLRGFYFDFEKLAPGPLLKTTDEIIDNIKMLEKSHFQLPDSFEPFFEKFCNLEDGNASKRVVDAVFK